VLLKQIQVIEKALDYIGLVDSSISQYFKEVPNYFVPLIGPDGTLPSSSNSSVDTMFWYSATHQPLLKAEMIIHEFSHQRVFRLQDKDPLIDPKVHGSGWDICEIYSPWRDDPRPVNGVFHGFVVFTEAAKFWMSLINLGGLQPEELDISKRRMTMLALQLDHAQKSLATCTYTELGKTVFDAYAEVLEGMILPYIKKHNLGDLKPFFMEFHDQEQPIGVSIAEVVEGHKSQWIARNGGRN
jgi:HEXXH motif-containing protein